MSDHIPLGGPWTLERVEVLGAVFEFLRFDGELVEEITTDEGRGPGRGGSTARTPRSRRSALDAISSPVEECPGK